MCCAHEDITDAWTEQLDFTRACTSVSSQDRCWLTEHLAPWNEALHTVSYELFECRPAKLRLQYIPPKSIDEDPCYHAHRTAFLISWLVKNHVCIDELCVLNCSPPRDPAVQREPAPIHLRPPSEQSSLRNMRCLEVHSCSPETFTGSGCCYLQEQDLPYLCGLECIKVTCRNNRLDAALAKVLHRNADSLRTVEIIQPTLSQDTANALQCLTKCESMMVSFCSHGSDSCTDILRRLVRSVPSLKTLGFHSYASQPVPCNAHGIADTLREKKTLTTLDLYMHENDISDKDLFATLEMNTSLKTLRFCFNTVDASCGDALASALSKNSCLLCLDVGGVVADYCMVRLAEALLENTVLENLHLTRAWLSVSGVLALCDALHTNKTLKKLFLPRFSACNSERVALAETLARCDGYGRVRLPYLTEPDLRMLSTRLACRASCPVELDRIDISSISEEDVKLIFDALSSSFYVHSLEVQIDQNQEAKVTALCKMLKINQSIRQVYIAVQNDEGRFVHEFLCVLNVNQHMSEITLKDVALEAKTASALSDFFARNRTVTKFQLFMNRNFCDSFLEQLSRGVSMNPVIVDFKLRECYDNRTVAISNAIRRNKAVLNYALDFVVRCDTDRQRAEAFEVFSETTGLITHLMRASQLTDREAVVAIASAKNFLWDNYLIITGVVQHSMACYPAHEKTQCDQLNRDCWRAIMRHLKVTDVLA